MSKRKVRADNLVLNDHAAADRQPPATKRKRVDIIKSTNRIPFPDFIAQHVLKDNLRWTPRRTHEDGYTFELEVKTVPYSTMPTAAADQIMTAQELDACFDLIHSTSHEAYAHSSIGWHPRRKKREMREAEMRYLIIRARTSNSSQGRKSGEAEIIIPPPHATTTTGSVSSSSNSAPRPAGTLPDAPPPPLPTDIRAPTTAVNPAPNSDKTTDMPRSPPAKLSSTTLSLTSTRAGQKVSPETERSQTLNALQKVSPADDTDWLFATTAAQHDEIGRVAAANGSLPAVTAAASRFGDSDQDNDVGSDDLDHVGAEPAARQRDDETYTTCPARDDNSNTAVPASTSTSQSAPEIIGFASFMLTHAPPEPVIYLYELHLQPAYRTFGLGAHLLRTIEDVGRSVGVQRAMLTVFKSNIDARDWYARKGWNVDSTSPSDVELRRGSRECDYEIRSKVL